MYLLSLHQVGFFCAAGPVKIFVSNYLIPEEFQYQSTEEAAFVSSDGESIVKAGCDVRIRIVGVRLEGHECVSVPCPLLWPFTLPIQLVATVLTTDQVQTRKPWETWLGPACTGANTAFLANQHKMLALLAGSIRLIL